MIFEGRSQELSVGHFALGWKDSSICDRSIVTLKYV